MFVKRTINLSDTNKDYSASLVSKAVDQFNAIAEEISEGYYIPGYRNNFAVDLCCVCYVLNLEPEEIFIDLVEKYTDYGSVVEDFCGRADIIRPYLEWWNDEPNGVFDKMLEDREVEDQVKDKYLELV